MSRTKETAPFLVVARAARVRRGYERSIAETRPAIGVEPDALGDATRFVDAAGGTVHLRAAPDHVYLFDPDSGKTLAQAAFTEN